MFNTNKYTTMYYSIINNARSQDRSKSESYFELHHVQPKSLGGSNKQDNLILLTAREHFLCHLLLTKMFDAGTIEYYKMLHSFMLMKGSNSLQTRYINSKLYESIKKQYSVYQSNKRKNSVMSKEQKQKISNSMKGHFVSEETKQKISKSASSRKRQPFSDEYKKRMSEVMKARHRWV